MCFLVLESDDTRHLVVTILQEKNIPARSASPPVMGFSFWTFGEVRIALKFPFVRCPNRIFRPARFVSRVRFHTLESHYIIHKLILRFGLAARV